MLRLQGPLPERYTHASADDLVAMIENAKQTLGSRLLILGHHYQRDEVMRWADMRGDSFGLSRMAAARDDAEFLVFCGVHFMAESADVLTGPNVKVVLPDLNAGCSMADMADLESVEEAWEAIAAVTDIERVVPITYMNSSAALKAFVGRNGGAVCTSSNARAVLTWALDKGPSGPSERGAQGPSGPSERGAQGPSGPSERGAQGPSGPSERGARGEKVLFFPDQHLGRNTGVQLGYGLDDMRVWDPRRELGGLDEREVKESTLLLWKGHCSVHQRFTPGHVEAFRARHPEGIVIAHPECSHEVVQLADRVGSTDFIIKAIEAAPPGSHVAVATEIHLVQRLAAEHPEVSVESLDPLICPCSTMFRIDAKHLAWILEGLVEGEVRNQITVDADTTGWARVALERMLDIT